MCFNHVNSPDYLQLFGLLQFQLASFVTAIFFKEFKKPEKNQTQLKPLMPDKKGHKLCHLNVIVAFLEFYLECPKLLFSC